MSQTGLDNKLPRRGFRIFGLPVQFVIVSVVSLALTIYMAGLAASVSIETRAARASGERLGMDYQTSNSEMEIENWERAALTVCPLH